MDGDPLELKVTATKRKKPKPEKVWKRHRTSVPRTWELRLQRATRISTYRLAHELLYRQWRADQDMYCYGDDPVVVTGKLAAVAGLTVRSAGNALDELARLGLVKVARANGRSPRATLLRVPIKTRRPCRHPDQSPP